MQDAETFCGISGRPKVTSLSYKLILEFTAKTKSYARFRCNANVVDDFCECGIPNRNNSGKIVGGVQVRKF